MSQYDPAAVEAKWQKKWEKAKVYKVDLQKAKEPFYTHVMYPYPSGDKLHVGHWYNFGPADSFARFMRMHGKDVFSPMGFDAFGLPAENYAIKTGIHPDTSTKKNVETMIRQLKRIGCMYDWDRMVNTSQPEYYKWTQWLFLTMFENGLAYKKEGNVNFCPSCQTVLANEQVWDGKCERCDSEVVQKPMKQWFWKITDYADRLLFGLEKLDWPEKTKIMQRNWIGRKEGINIVYRVEGTQEELVCFTTRPDTNFGATFVVLAPEHAFVRKAMDEEIVPQGQRRSADVRGYVKEALNKTELERQEEGRKKTGVFTGFYAINNLTGYKMPVWVSDFVLGGFGTGAVVGVPGHDKRDFEFAQGYDMKVIRVVRAADGDMSPITSIDQVQEEEGTMVNSQFLDGLDIHTATQKIMDHMEKEGQGKRIVNYRIRDWLISRQRYWGAPIPIVYDPEGKPHPIPEKHLPWELPTDVEFRPTGTAPLAQSKELVARTEKIFGKGWKPEVDTMDTFVCSSYYSLMYLASENKGEQYRQRPLTAGSPVDKKLEAKWLPVDMYIGGAEHACMHLIYARFVGMVLKDLGFIEHEEQYQRLIHQGVITNQGAKMSKSRGNVVSPDEFVEHFGSDVFRMYLMFMGPFTEGGDWSDTGIKGVDRFVQRVWRLYSEKLPSGRKLNKKVDQVDAQMTSKLHATVKKVTEDIERLHFNTALSALMELLNVLEKQDVLAPDVARTYATLLAPLAPHLAEEVWEYSGGKGFVIDQDWPSYDASQLVASTITIVVQVNGKVRGEFTASPDITEKEALEFAKAEENVQRHLEGKKIKKEMYIPGKLVSLVVA
ncbi:leucine--tRNA ligase [Candidatus Peregrinibacteria bacterium CG10_big_fil_rev_8_21_14_0_10_54_7]|nr:MAG: leucine--tRNA ligase [Candidatus Peregrinibacteria bacterium CG10_big_fil_rev_8_21_14_0_10_54_7]